MQIIPIKDMKDTAKIADLCAASKEPIFITKNGYGEMVLMSMQAYEESQEEKMILQRLLRAKRENLISGEQSEREIAKLYE